MSTTQKTDQSAKFDPSSMTTYQGLQGGLGGLLNQFMTQPFGQQFGLESQMGTRQAQGLGGQGMSNLLRNMTASGMAGGASSPAGLEMQQNQGRANTGLQAQLGFMNPTMNALMRQQAAMGMSEQYRPLQTGQTQTQSTGGLGTWLPQVAGMALGMLGGMPGLGMGGGGGASGPGAFGLPNFFQPTQSSFNFPQQAPGTGSWAGAGPGMPGFGPPPPPGTQGGGG